MFPTPKQLPVHRLIRHESPEAVRRNHAFVAHLRLDMLYDQVDHLQRPRGLFSKHETDLGLIGAVIRGRCLARVPDR